MGIRNRDKNGRHVDRQMPPHDLTQKPASSLRNLDIATYALYRLGGGERKIDTEDIALQCHRLAPERFSWRKRPELPGGVPTLYALQDARRKRYGGLVRGGVKGGWILTPVGVDHVRLLLPVLEKLAAGEIQVSSDRQHVQRYFRELETHPAFQRYLRDKSCDGVKPYEFTDFLKCTFDSAPDVIKDRIETIRTRAHEAGKHAILDFLALCEKRFADMVTVKR